MATSDASAVVESVVASLMARHDHAFPLTADRHLSVLDHGDLDGVLTVREIVEATLSVC